jgi:dehydrogenase/reductase SDR family member 1
LDGNHCVEFRLRRRNEAIRSAAIQRLKQQTLTFRCAADTTRGSHFRDLKLRLLLCHQDDVEEHQGEHLIPVSHYTEQVPVAMVTGASRGVGRGVAIALAEAGFQVYATGRGIAAADLPRAVRKITCDHLDDSQTRAAFEQLPGHLDLLVNNAWGGYERMLEDGQFTWALPFWEQPMHRWTAMLDTGVRAAFVASSLAAKMMVPRGRGLIVNISSWASRKRIGNVIYGVSKAATDKMTSDMAQELGPHGVAAIALYPGLVRTESVVRSAEAGWFDLSNSESPEFIGRVIAALWRDPKLLERSGQVLVAAAVASELDILDVDGKQPAPLTIDTA